MSCHFRWADMSCVKVRGYGYICDYTFEAEPWMVTGGTPGVIKRLDASCSSG